MNTLIAIGVIMILIISYRFLENARRKKEREDYKAREKRIRMIRQMNKTESE